MVSRKKKTRQATQKLAGVCKGVYQHRYYGVFLPAINSLNYYLKYPEVFFWRAFFRLGIPKYQHESVFSRLEAAYWDEVFIFRDGTSLSVIFMLHLAASGCGRCWKKCCNHEQIFHSHFPVHRGSVCFRRWLQPFCSKANDGWNYLYIDPNIFSQVRNLYDLHVFCRKRLHNRGWMSPVENTFEQWTPKKNVFFVKYCVVKY